MLFSRNPFAPGYKNIKSIGSQQFYCYNILQLKALPALKVMALHLVNLTIQRPKSETMT